ncbi:MAG TPA: site-2 protease family protein [Opitutaceae bacterium]|nr:site-2 protease family protein [Opitutaceae bacterium]
MIFRLPSLREELAILEGPRTHDGQPTWTLHDPARNRFFRLDWLTFEILQRWSLGDPHLITQSIGAQTPLQPDADDIESVLNFASANQLLSFAGADNSASLSASRSRAHPSWWQWLIHNYLFFRIPLIQPDRLLQALVKSAKFLFSRSFAFLTACAGIVGLALVWRQWDAFKAVWLDYANLNGYLGYVVVLVLVKVIHEFGHGLMATRFGCRVPSMGLAFLVMTPVAYTDTNDAWKLTDRKSRLWIGAAGMLAELTLAAWATLAWTLLPNGFFRSAAFMVATTTWLKSVLINTSPVMRFDGYYLLSDSLEMPNLHARAFALARWRLREALFNLGEPAPEIFPPKLKRGLIALAMFIWAYRLVVFTGIAVFVYHFFFKALGIVLFGVEMGWFIALPIFSEAKAWWERRRSIRRSPRRWWVALGFSASLALCCIPLPKTIRVTGQLTPGQEYIVSSPEAARIGELDTRDAERVEAGATLLRLESPALDARLAKIKSREISLTDEISASSSNPATQRRVPILQQELASAHASRHEIETAQAQLQFKAPFAGTFRLADPDLRAEQTVGRQEILGTVISDHGAQIVTYVDERDRGNLKVGAVATIYFASGSGQQLKLRVTAIEADATRLLSHPMLATPFGGSVPARVFDNDIVPENAVYRVTLVPLDSTEMLPTQVRVGHVAIHAGAESLIKVWVRNALSVLWRELGF